MTIYQGNIRKMQVSTDTQHLAQYQLPIGEQHINMNALLGKEIKVSFDNLINCIYCQTKTKKSFNQGYCYRCLTKLAQCDTCIIKPELCHYDAGTCREPSWGEANCLSDHYVYLANTGTIKVGITRHVSEQISSRWLDQGATQAMAIMRVQNRLTSGLVETAMKEFIADKTNWRTMLKSQPDTSDLQQLKEDLITQIEDQLDEITDEYGFQAIDILDLPAVDIHYPVEQYPEKVKSINLDKELTFSGVLQGLKGQYWMLDGDRVINMRKYSGYHLTIETPE
ncbi:DUF2797 domain-containing protein [Paraglaciecola polaris]|mgnify:FL=1|uniref:DUF2797 domain-containing protein n=1 Tax=Paraglaciecola polaris LMG 21857 TaxID=1129793 RepID=K6ZYW8_9ALTE|nr:DUF2797 domain-containing protein [Paraglaciecola polaris]GAC33923.1 hypothetical protein GPLA_3030 [Paraglaciecola polaris LMG 21857]|tara:strand:+ start:488 stop:1330 length:843 start_codon:yes stop_codon:yes gene_type:complete